MGLFLNYFLSFLVMLFFKKRRNVDNKLKLSAIFFLSSLIIPPLTLVGYFIASLFTGELDGFVGAGFLLVYVWGYLPLGLLGLAITGVIALLKKRKQKSAV